MKYIFSALFFLLFFTLCVAQESNTKDVDSLYKEDQFYAGVTYNVLNNTPDNLTQSGFSLGFHFGFIKDMPINKSRNLALGIGLGYSANSFNQDLFIDNSADITNYSIIEDNTTFSKNKFATHIIELPIEFRWRTSTPENYNFWRIYTGFKFGYVLRNVAKYKGDLGDLKYTNIKDFNNFQYGLTLSTGYNTWNVFLYYALNPIFSEDASLLNGNALDMNSVKIGLMFYIL